MQKCIDGATEDQRQRLVEVIITYTKEFVRNPYGNYVIQYVLDLKDYDVNTVIGKHLQGKLIDLITYEDSRKFSSNVIEKCLQLNHNEMKNQMVKEMLGAESYLPFLKDQYGNYVVQKTLAVAEPEDLETLISKIKPDMEYLRKSSEFGRKIYNKLVKSYPALQTTSFESKNKNNKNNKANSKKNYKNK